MKSNPIQTLTTAIVMSGNLFIREATRLFRPYGITVPQFDALEMLTVHPSGLRQNELATSLVVDPSTATYLIDNLEKRNWIARTPDPTDRRAHRVVLTDEGRAIHAQASKPYRAALAALETQFDPVAVEAATRLLLAMRPAAAAAVRQAEALAPKLKAKKR
jgi:DNA-binding MarR family transcriptional regulator